MTSVLLVVVRGGSLCVLPVVRDLPNSLLNLRVSIAILAARTRSSTKLGLRAMAGTARSRLPGDWTGSLLDDLTGILFVAVMRDLPDGALDLLFERVAIAILAVRAHPCYKLGLRVLRPSFLAGAARDELSGDWAGALLDNLAGVLLILVMRDLPDGALDLLGQPVAIAILTVRTPSCYKLGVRVVLQISSTVTCVLPVA